MVPVYDSAGNVVTVLGSQKDIQEFTDARYAFVNFVVILSIIFALIFTEYCTKLSKGDRLFVYTDGVTEATDKNEQLFGDDRLISAIECAKNMNAPDTLKCIRAQIDAFAGDAEQFDDITMLQFELLK